MGITFLKNSLSLYLEEKPPFSGHSKTSQGQKGPLSPGETFQGYVIYPSMSLAHFVTKLIHGTVRRNRYKGWKEACMLISRGST